MSAELEARRTAAAAVLADYRAELASAPISRPPGREWMLRLADALGGLLTVLHQAVILGQDQAATALDALDVASEYRRYRASLTCEACTIHPAGLCEEHATDLDRAEEYDQLARRIRDAR
jgi:hypothetical protein